MNIQMLGASIPDTSTDEDGKITVKNTAPKEVSGADLFNRFKK